MLKDEYALQREIRRNGLTIFQKWTREKILELPSLKYREIKTHRLYGCGRPDLASLKDETLYIIELKYSKAKHQDVGQLMAYLNYFQFLLDRGKIKIDETIPKSVNGILIAKTYHKRLKKQKRVTLDMSVFWAAYPMREKIMFVEWTRRGSEIAFSDVTRDYEDIFRFMTERKPRKCQ